MSNALGQFCQLKASIQEMDARRKQAVAGHDATRCKLRDGLIDWMRKTDMTVVQLPEARGPDGQVQYRCIRLRQCTSQRAITAPVVERSFTNLLFSGSVPKDSIALNKGPERVADIKAQLYNCVRSSCTAVTPGITVTSTKKKPTRVPSEQQAKQQQLSVADLARLAQIADAYVASAESIKERRGHYNRAKSILQTNLAECEPKVQNQLQQKRLETGRATATVDLVTSDAMSKADEQQEQKYVVCLHTSRAGPLGCQIKRLNYTILKTIIDKAAERRIRKLEARGVHTIATKDFIKMLAADVVAAVKHYTDAAAEERRRLAQQRKQDPASAASKVVLRKKKLPAHWQPRHKK